MNGKLKITDMFPYTMTPKLTPILQTH